MVVEVYNADMYNLLCRHIRTGGLRFNIMVIILTTTNAYLPIVLALVNSAEKYNIPTPIGTDILCWVRTGICKDKVLWQSIVLPYISHICVQLRDRYSILSSYSTYCSRLHHFYRYK